MKNDYRTLLRQDAKDALDCLLLNREDFFVYADAIKNIDSNLDINMRKYGLESVLKNISYVLGKYMDECDYISFGDTLRKKEKVRKYSVKPYIDQALYEIMWDLLDDIEDEYLYETRETLLVEKGVPKTSGKGYDRLYSLGNLVEDIRDSLYSYDFTFDVEDSISHMRVTKVSVTSSHK